MLSEFPAFIWIDLALTAWSATQPLWVRVEVPDLADILDYCIAGTYGVLVTHCVDIAAILSFNFFFIL
jgi:hypothetical protein